MKCTHFKCNQTAIPGKMVCSQHYRGDFLTEESFEYMGKQRYTIGGQLEIYAQHWNAENHQKLGDILYKMLIGNKELRAKAQVDFFTMKRTFMKDEWEEYIKKVDDYRASLGVRTLSDFMNESIKESLNINSKFSPATEVFHLPDQKAFLNAEVVPVPVISIPVEDTTDQEELKPEPVIPQEGLQLSLF